jgi:uncharacterized protein
MSPLQFDLSGLREKPMVSFERSIDAVSAQPLLAAAAVLTSPLVVRIDVARHGAGMSFQGTAEGEWEFTCVRCLGPARMQFRAGVEGEIPANQETLDAAEEVRQSLILALPSNPYCRTDCKGLCPQCGGDRNVADCGCRPPEFGLRRKDA